MPETLLTHDANVFPDPLVINPDALPNLANQSVVEIIGNGISKSKTIRIHSTLSDTEHNHIARISASQDDDLDDKRIFLTPKCLSAAQITRSPHLRVSISDQVANLFNIKYRQSVTIKATENTKHEARITHIVLYIRDQYVSQSDVWRLSSSLVNQCIYVNQTILFLGSVRAVVGSLWRNQKSALSGFVTSETKFVVRSVSARILLFVQVSTEMWDFENDSKIYHSKITEDFLASLFRGWYSIGAHHLVTIVLFARVFSIVDGTKEDYYRVVTENETRQKWNHALGAVKAAIPQFRKEILIQEDPITGKKFIGRKLAAAQYGNVFETVGLALNHFQMDYFDRDLSRTGTSVIIITPGTGFFEVDKTMLNIASETVLESNLGLDIVCMGRRPLHMSPLVRYKIDKTGASSNDSPEYQYEKPFFVHTSYLADIDLDRFADDIRRGSHQYCKCPSLQPVSRVDNEMTTIDVPYLKDSDDYELKEGFFEKYDRSVFEGSTIKKPIKSDTVSKGRSSTSSTRSSLMPTLFGLNISHSKALTSVSVSSVRADCHMPDVINDDLSDSLSKTSISADSTSDLNLVQQMTETPEKKFTSRTSLLRRNNSVDSGIITNPLIDIAFQMNDQHFQKWKHVYITSTFIGFFNWGSLSAPASLPVTNEYFPGTRELNEEFSEYTYSVTSDPDILLISVKNLIIEMISQRLNQGFQIVLQKLNGVESERDTDIEPRLLKGALEPDITEIYLSYNNTEIHHLSCDIQRQTVEVRRFVKNRRRFAKAEYSCMIRHTLSDVYNHRPLVLGVSEKLQQQPWNHIDHCIAGYETRLLPSVRYWSTRYVLIPADLPSIKLEKSTLDDESLRVLGINKLHNLIAKCQFKHASAPEYVFVELTDPDLQYTTLRKSEHVIQNAETFSETSSLRVSEYIQMKDKFTKSDYRIHDLMNQLTGEHGLRRKDRRWHNKIYEDCFLGSNLVTWLKLNFSDIPSREDAVSFGNTLLDRGVIAHVENKHPLIDGHFFYIFRRGGLQNSSSWFNRNISNASQPNSPLTIKRNGRRRSISTTASGNETIRFKFIMSKSTLVDIDPQKRSYRPEFVTLHYDTIYNPNECYHLRFDWIGVTAKFIEDLVRSWGHALERYGLRIIEMPIPEITSLQKLWPFRETLPIKLALDPPTNFPELPKEWWIEQILFHWDFILDTEAAHEFPANLEIVNSWQQAEYQYTQYVHLSGVSIVQIDDNGTIHWMSNRLHANRAFVRGGRGSTIADEKTIPSQSIDFDYLRDSFAEWCANPEHIEKLYLKLIQEKINNHQNFQPLDQNT